MEHRHLVEASSAAPVEDEKELMNQPVPIPLIVTVKSIEHRTSGQLGKTERSTPLPSLPCK
jgi:hypothetical protein